MSALDWPGHWNPYGAGHTVLRRSVPCEGCLLKVCERERMRCLKEITVEDVVDACTTILLRADGETSIHRGTEIQRKGELRRSQQLTIGAVV